MMVVRPYKLYLAASWSRRFEMQDYAKFLKGQGYEITSRWLSDNYVKGQTATNALMDEEDVKSCDALLVFTDEVPQGRGGRHVEFGMARALGKRIVLIGPKEHIFHYLPGIEIHSGWSSFRGDM